MNHPFSEESLLESEAFVSEELQVTLLAIPAIVMALLLLTGLVLVVRDTVRGRGIWGINPRPVHCPRCGEPAPVVRVPANSRQFWWGGATCKECGTEYDKWGIEVAVGPRIPPVAEQTPMQRKSSQATEERTQGGDKNEGSSQEGIRADF
ncbi:MAG: hypothetical protein SNJ82_03990 [Gemmataceae bacterium]